MKNKMKWLHLGLASILAVSIMAGCSKKAEPEQIENESAKVVTTYKSEEAKDLAKAEKDFIAEQSKIAGVHRKGDLILVSLGAKNSDGYKMEFVKQEEYFEEVKLYIKITKPKEGESVSAETVYPMITGRISIPKNVTLSVLDADTNKPIEF